MLGTHARLMSDFTCIKHEIRNTGSDPCLACHLVHIATDCWVSRLILGFMSTKISQLDLGGGNKINHSRGYRNTWPRSSAGGHGAGEKRDESRNCFKTFREVDYGRCGHLHYKQ